MITQVLRILLPALALAASAHAQLSASLQMSKRQYVAGEPVMAVINITNHSGRDLVFGGSDRISWLDFIVRTGQGHPLTPFRAPAFGTVTIGAGQSMARQVNLSTFFPLSDSGNFSVNGVVRMPGETREGTATNRSSFILMPGRSFWSQKVGLPDRPGKTREFRVLSASNSGKTSIYAQVIDDSTGLSVATFAIGEVIMSRNPMVSVDRQQRLHILYLATPAVWVHAIVTTDGELLDRSLHQRGPQGDPKLLALGDGSVSVSNSLPFNAEAVRTARAQVRKISDRPAFLFE